jgi:hypothetical protein
MGPVAHWEHREQLDHAEPEGSVDGHIIVETRADGYEEMDGVDVTVGETRRPPAVELDILDLIGPECSTCGMAITLSSGQTSATNSLRWMSQGNTSVRARVEEFYAA